MPREKRSTELHRPLGSKLATAIGMYLGELVYHALYIKDVARGVNTMHSHSRSTPKRRRMSAEQQQRGQEETET